MSIEPADIKITPDVAPEAPPETAPADIKPLTASKPVRAAAPKSAKAATDPAERTYRVQCSMLGAHRGVKGSDGEYLMTEGGFLKGEVVKAGQLGPGVNIDRLVELGAVAPCGPEAVSVVEAG